MFFNPGVWCALALPLSGQNKHTMEKMRGLITAFPEQLKQAWEIAQKNPIDLNDWTP